MMSDDINDVPAALAGDRQAFGRLYDRHAGVVLSFCRHFLSLAEAEDAMQETFLRAYRRLDRLHQSASFRPWLYAIAKRVCSERQRSMKRKNRHEAQAAMKRNENESDIATPMEVVEQAEQLQRLSGALDLLSDNERLAIHLYYLDSNPQEAAAGVLGLSRSGFYKLLARARNRLAGLMREVEKA
ncbi:MAG: sigma-70 family RNA polymerase sigma factor [Planctomycetota bacterium]|nr:MAG: sigma-70 family RNA polymerase sigma factor [Planctomycetota bacterium]